MVDGHHHASGKRDHASLVTAADTVIDGALWLTASADAGKTIYYGIIDLGYTGNPMDKGVSGLSHRRDHHSVK